MSTFQIFGDMTVGRIFVPDGFCFNQVKYKILSPIHGRSIAIEVERFKWILVKGGGWNYKGPQVYLSKKDEELVFGLYPLVSAERELAVSKEIEKISNDFPKVLYYKKFSDYKLPQQYDFLKEIKFKNGNLVEPCLLYTQVKCPYRVADLMYITGKKRREVIESCCAYWGVGNAQYIEKFTKTLAHNVAVLHKNGFINDTLEYSNVTLLGEIVDYEWVTAPGIRLIDGTLGLEIMEERREKELIYGAEVCLQLKALLHKKYNLFDIYRDFVESYSEINFQFIKNNSFVQKMLKREKIII